MKSNFLRAAFTIGLYIAFTAACKKSNISAPSRPTAAPVDLSMPPSAAEGVSLNASGRIQNGQDRELHRLVEKKYANNPKEKEAILQGMAKVDALDDAEKKLAEAYRRTMITAAPPDFRPEPVARKIRLRLILEKSQIEKRDEVRFRLEMTNVGRDSIDYQENSAGLFVKGAGLEDSTVMHFFITDPNGKREQPDPGWGPDFKRKTSPAPSSGIKQRLGSNSDADNKRWLAETGAMSEASANFKIRLRPGETLHSLGDDDSPQQNFRTLFIQYDFDKPGAYKLQVKLDDRPDPVTEQDIVDAKTYATPDKLRQWHDQRLHDALGPASSNIVTVQVTR